jgi:hypothetical protein
MSTRSWSRGDPRWGWPDDVDITGTETAGGYRYLPITQTCGDGYTWTVARVYADEDDDEMLADARLISAAPDMLAALHVAANAIDYGQAQVDSEEDRYKLRKWLVQVKRVIAKAEGRE